MKEKIQAIFLYLVIIVIFGGFIYGAWEFKRWLNYKWGYQSQVQEDIEPLRKEIEDLKKRVLILEKDKKK